MYFVQKFRPTSWVTNDVFVDLLRMQAGLPLIDADMAVAECGKCIKKPVDRLGYHAAFCPSTSTYIHDAIVNELGECLSNAGACVLHEPINVLPHTHSMDPALQPQGEIFRPDLQRTYLDDTGKRYLVDVTTGNVSAKTYRVEVPGAAAAKAATRKTRVSKADGRMTVVLPAAVELTGRWGDGMLMLFEKAVDLATKAGKSSNGELAIGWKRRISTAARRGMIYQAHYALRKHLRHTLRQHGNGMDTDEDDNQMNDL